MRTHNTGVVSLIPPCVAFKTPLVGKATGNQIMKSTSVEKTQPLVSATLEIKYATQFMKSLLAKRRGPMGENHSLIMS